MTGNADNQMTARYCEFHRTSSLAGNALYPGYWMTTCCKQAQRVTEKLIAASKNNRVCGCFTQEKFAYTGRRTRSYNAASSADLISIAPALAINLIDRSGLFSYSGFSKKQRLLGGDRRITGRQALRLVRRGQYFQKKPPECRWLVGLYQALSRG